MAKKKSKFTEDDDALLAELGVETKVVKAKKYTAVEERVIAGFEEIQRFVSEHGRPPAHGEQNDIFERLYAVRLDRIRSDEQWRELLADMDPDGLLDGQAVVAEDTAEYENASDDELLDALGVETAPAENLTKLKYVRSKAEIQAAEEVAQRKPCADFNEFRPVFDAVQGEIDLGARITEPYQTDSGISLGDLFIVEGNKVFVAELGEEFVAYDNRMDRRLRVIYDNGTESDLIFERIEQLCEIGPPRIRRATLHDKLKLWRFRI